MQDIIHTTTTDPPKSIQYDNIKTLSIIIPVYNEEKTITEILDKIKKVHLVRSIVKEIIIINDCSIDKTEQVITTYLSRSGLNIKL